MDRQFSERLLDVLIENCRRIFVNDFGITQAESSMLEVIALLESESNLKEYYLEKVHCTLLADDPFGLEPGGVPREMIELSVYHFRWPEFVAIANERLRRLFNNQKSYAVSDMATTIFDAYRDDWEDLEFYEKYQPSLRMRPAGDTDLR